MPNEFIIRNGLVVQSGTTIITGSLNVSGGITGSLQGVRPTISKHSFESPYDYCGTAPSGSLTSSPDWTIVRLTVYLDGSALSQTATGAWDNRANLIYI